MNEQSTRNQEPSTKEAPTQLEDPAGMMALGGAAGAGAGAQSAADIPLVMVSNPIDCELAELIGEKPGDFLVLYADGLVVEGFGSPFDSPGQRRIWLDTVEQLNTRTGVWEDFYESWGATLRKMHGIAEDVSAEAFRPVFSVRVHRVVSGYSQHINPAMRLLERLREKGIAGSYLIDVLSNYAGVTVYCQQARIPYFSSKEGANVTLPPLIAEAVLKLLKARLPRVGGADRLALAGDGKEGC